MSKFDYDFLPENVSGVSEIQTLGLSAELLEQLNLDDARTILLAMGKAMQTIAHPDKQNAEWSGPQSSDISLAASRIKNLDNESFAKALQTYLDNYEGIRQREFAAVENRQYAVENVNNQLGGAVLDIIGHADDVYSAYSGMVFTGSSWLDGDKGEIQESLYRLRFNEGEVLSVDRLERIGKLVERLPKAYHKPLATVRDALGGGAGTWVVVADNGSMLASHDPLHPNQLTDTGIALPSIADFPLAGSIIRFKDAKSATQIKQGAHIFCDKGSTDDYKLQRLVGAKYIGAYDPYAQKPELAHRVRPEIIKTIDKNVLGSEEAALNLLSKDQLQSLIVNGLVALRRGGLRGGQTNMVLITKQTTRPVAFLPEESLTINS